MGLTRGLALVAVVCALVAPARAMTEEEERAKAHFLAGQSYYDQASYSDALREFNEAYRISKRPALLYNIARCFEALEKYGDAVAMLQHYLDEDPGTSDRAAVETRIANLRERQAAAAARVHRGPSEPPETRASSPPPVAQPAPAVSTAPSPHARTRRYTWIVGGIGAAVLVAALGTGVASQLQYNDLESKCSGGTCDPATVANAQGKIDGGKRLALATDVLWPIGAAAVVTAVVLFFVEGRHADKHAASHGGWAFARAF
ncbi:MAG: tetratricopeptide repeat protein [Polyangia bacterium]